jgi:glycogen synthase
LINTTWQLFWKAKKEKYDIIHAHAYVSGLPAKIVGKLLKIPVVYTVHGVNQLDT